MSCVRKRGKSWNAQVRVSSWRSFTKSFNKRSDAIGSCSFSDEDVNLVIRLKKNT